MTDAKKAQLEFGEWPDDDREKPVLRPGDDPILDEALSKLRAHSKDGDALYWEVKAREETRSPDAAPDAARAYVESKTIPPSHDPTLEKMKIVVSGAEEKPRDLVEEIVAEDVKALPAAKSRAMQTEKKLDAPKTVGGRTVKIAIVPIEGVEAPRDSRAGRAKLVALAIMASAAALLVLVALQRPKPTPTPTPTSTPAAASTSTASLPTPSAVALEPAVPSTIAASADEHPPPTESSARTAPTSPRFAPSATVAIPPTLVPSSVPAPTTPPRAVPSIVPSTPASAISSSRPIF